MGAGKNVNRAPDLLSVLMIQNGAKMLNEKVLPAFATDESALQALTFYTDFANSTKYVYTWNLRSDYSLDAFAEGETAMMVNYSYHMGTIQAKNPRLNVGIAPLPQVELGSSDNPPKTYAGYWAFAVSRQTVVPDEAWAFVRSLTQTDPSRAYGKTSGYPPARRDLVAELQNDTRIGVFAKQSLIATTWRQADNRVVDRVFTEAIDAVVSGQDSPAGALRRAGEQIIAAAVAFQEEVTRRGLEGGPL
jgi:multiple sugar transport system substrate-binding protein